MPSCLWNKWRFCDWLNMVFFWHFTLPNKSHFKALFWLLFFLVTKLKWNDSRKIKLKRFINDFNENSVREIVWSSCGIVWLPLDIRVDTSVALKLNYQMQLIELSGVKTCPLFCSLLCVLCELMFVHCRVKFLHNVRNYSLRKYFNMVMNVGIAFSDGLKQRNVEVRLETEKRWS